MGLISAAINAASGVLADQWKEFIYCDSIPSDVLVVKGHKRTSGGNRGSDNIITNGSGIAVADGQCMMIVDNGQIVDVCAVPGNYTYDTSTEPSIFSGSLGEAIETTFALIGKRFSQGGDTGHDQRVYYFNTKELVDNKFGTPNPIPFRVVDANVNLDTEVDLRCSGVYSYRIADPLLFYSNVCGNVAESFTQDEIDTQLKAEFVAALAPALAKISALGIRPSDLLAHYSEITEALNEQLNASWGEKRGLKLVSIALNPITLSPEDSDRIKAAQTAAVYSDPAMGAGVTVQAAAQAMQDAANNSAGAMTGFMGMGMAQNTGNAAAGMYAQAAQGQPQTVVGVATGAPAASWTCSKCGTQNNGKFCIECGEAKPGMKVCPSCGYNPENLPTPPKFCPQCGAKFE